ncbi:MAG: helix-turn-helix transcriptional regulator [Meiothermus sp.]|nr:helix-turn-helix transcriptional regulator [Meiothermus sp.]
MREHPSEIAQALSELMERRKMSANALSKASGVANGYIYDLLSGKKGEQIGFHVLRRLAQGLRVKTSYLVYRIEKISSERIHASNRQA